jgi:hypothetical protein
MLGSSRTVGLAYGTGVLRTDRNPFWELPKNRVTPFILSGMAVEYQKADGSYRRIAGYLPGERRDTVKFWHLRRVGMPSDTIAPASSWRELPPSAPITPANVVLPTLPSGSALVTCNACTPVVLGNTQAVQVVGNGGSTIFETTVPTTPGVKAATKFAIDVQTPGCSIGGWEQLWFIRVNPSANLWWDSKDVRLTRATSSSWVTYQFPWNGTVLPTGSTTNLKIAINTNCANTLYISNPRFLP